MRKVENSQMEFGEIAIGEIHIEAKSRDDIPACCSSATETGL